MNPIIFVFFFLIVQTACFLYTSGDEIYKPYWSYKVLHVRENTRYIFYQFPNDKLLDLTVGELQWQNFFNQNRSKYIPISFDTGFDFKNYSSCTNKIEQKLNQEHSDRREKYEKINQVTIAFMIDRINSKKKKKVSIQS